MPAAALPDESSAASRHDSYRQILHSSVLIGGASALSLLIGVVRTKLLAVLLGPAGIGLLGIFTSVIDLARSAAQFGIHNSGVRQIAESVASDDAQRVARTVIVLRRIAVALGMAGALALVALASTVSEWAFGNEAQTAAIAWLSLAVFFRLVGDGQAALLQGSRRIGDLARIAVLGSVVGAVVSVTLAAVWGEASIVPGLVAATALATAISWWTARAVRVAPVRLSSAEVRTEAASLLKLGLAFMASGLLMAGAAFAVRSLVLQSQGVDAAGLYHAAWTLGGLYVGFVLQAMGTDFYPRLVGVVADRRSVTRMVNEQAHVSLLLAGPGVVGTVVLAGVALHAFYSEAFAAASETLRWISLGMALRVITWPMGYIIVAHNQRLVFFATELAWTAVNIGLSWWLIGSYGLTGAGMAFFGSYVFHGVMVYAVVRSQYGFAWAATAYRQGLFFVAACGCAFLASEYLQPVWALAVGSAVLVTSCAHSLRALARLAPDALPAAVRRAMDRRSGTRQENPHA